MAQKVGKSPVIKVDWEIPPTFELIRFHPETREPICLRPANDRPGEKVPVLDDDGNPTYRVDRNGKRLGQRFRWTGTDPEKVIGRRSPRGHIRWDKYVEETEAERTQRLRASMISKTQEELAAALVDSGMSATELVRRLAGGGALPELEDDELEDDELELEDDEELEGDGESFPRHVAHSWYLLSNGAKIQGKENAEKAEAMLQADDSS